ncbi:MAG: glycosyltransferase [Candidatus Aminicenantes bacterium]|nr:glycosyltransferase [Candidatus Aminicenantes bacterium]
MPEAVFPGYLQGRELSAAHANADQFLFPSATETFGNVVLEALASGLPAVVSDQGGCADIIHDSCGGLICPTDDYEAFFQACRRLIEQPKLHEEKQVRGLRYAKNRSWLVINHLPQFFRFPKTIAATFLAISRFPGLLLLPTVIWMYTSPCSTCRPMVPQKASSPSLAKAWIGFRLSLVCQKTVAAPMTAFAGMTEVLIMDICKKRKEREAAVFQKQIRCPRGFFFGLLSSPS